ncbi:MAG: hypothetical protein K2X11_12205 [Acetobacteraceae bacterium]|nr:hypothetical protein [Acetobacteraceae bacterium]
MSRSIAFAATLAALPLMTGTAAAQSAVQTHCGGDVIATFSGPEPSGGEQVYGITVLNSGGSTWQIVTMPAGTRTPLPGTGLTIDPAQPMALEGRGGVNEAGWTVARVRDGAAPPLAAVIPHVRVTCAMASRRPR